MPQELSCQGVIIKKQPFNEADEIITVFTEEQGKIRALAKSVKLGTSKLQPLLQPIFLNRLFLAGRGNLPKIIGVKNINAYQALQSNSDLVQIWYVIAELLNKALPDEHKNTGLFKLVMQYLEFLNLPMQAEEVVSASLVKFKIEFMNHIGLRIHIPTNAEADQVRDGIIFSANKGGFYRGQITSDARVVSNGAWAAFQQLQQAGFREITSQEGIVELAELVNEFITYQLEREMKAERFLPD